MVPRERLALALEVVDLEEAGAGDGNLAFNMEKNRPFYSILLALSVLLYRYLTQIFLVLMLLRG